MHVEAKEAANAGVSTALAVHSSRVRGCESQAIPVISGTTFADADLDFRETKTSTLPQSCILKPHNLQQPTRFLQTLHVPVSGKAGVCTLHTSDRELGRK